MMITVSVNNQNTALSANTTLADALSAWGYGEKKVAVAINQEFVPRSAYAATQLRADDKIDIVAPVGGG
jgi:sulfur carrier protein